jgi:hypothetical protein
VLGNAENSKNAVKFRIDSSSFIIASAFYPIKSHKKCRKMHRNSENSKITEKCRKIPKMQQISELIIVLFLKIQCFFQ